MLHNCRHYTWLPTLSGRVVAIQLSLAVVGVGGSTASFRRPLQSLAFIFRGLCPQFVVILASPGARGVFVRALAVQGWIYSVADE